MARPNKFLAFVLMAWGTLHLLSCGGGSSSATNNSDKPSQQMPVNSCASREPRLPDNEPVSPLTAGEAAFAKLLVDYSKRLEADGTLRVKQSDVAELKLADIGPYYEKHVVAAVEALEKHWHWFANAMWELKRPLDMAVADLERTAKLERENSYRLAVLEPTGDDGIYQGEDAFSKTWVVIETEKCRPKRMGDTARLGPIQGKFLRAGISRGVNAYGVAVEHARYVDMATDAQDRLAALKHDIGELERATQKGAATLDSKFAATVNTTYKGLLDTLKNEIESSVKSQLDEALKDLREKRDALDTCFADCLTGLSVPLDSIKTDKTRSAVKEWVTNSSDRRAELLKGLKAHVGKIADVFASMKVETSRLATGHSIQQVRKQVHDGDLLTSTIESYDRARNKAIAEARQQITDWAKAELARQLTNSQLALATPSLADRLAALTKTLNAIARDDGAGEALASAMSSALADWDTHSMATRNALTTGESEVTDFLNALCGNFPTTADAGVKSQMPSFDKQRALLLADLKGKISSAASKFLESFNSNVDMEVLEQRCMCGGISSDDDSTLYVTTDKLVRHNGLKVLATLNLCLSTGMGEPYKCSIERIGKFVVIKSSREQRGEVGLCVLRADISRQLATGSASSRVIVGKSGFVIFNKSVVERWWGLSLYDSDGKKAPNIGGGDGPAVLAFEQQGNQLVYVYENSITDKPFGAYDLDTLKEVVGYKPKQSADEFIKAFKERQTKVVPIAESRPALDWAATKLPLPVDGKTALVRTTVKGRLGSARWLRLDDERGTFQLELKSTTDNSRISEFGGHCFFGSGMVMRVKLTK